MRKLKIEDAHYRDLRFACCRHPNFKAWVLANKLSVATISRDDMLLFLMDNKVLDVEQAPPPVRRRSTMRQEIEAKSPSWMQPSLPMASPPKDDEVTIGYIVQDNIPIPGTRRTSVIPGWLHAADQINKGQSFFITMKDLTETEPDERKASKRVSARLCQIGPPKKFAVRTLVENGVLGIRVWRIE